MYLCYCSFALLTTVLGYIHQLPHYHCYPWAASLPAPSSLALSTTYCPRAHPPIPALPLLSWGRLSTMIAPSSLALLSLGSSTNRRTIVPLLSLGCHCRATILRLPLHQRHIVVSTSPLHRPATILSYPTLAIAVISVHQPPCHLRAVLICEEREEMRKVN